MQIWLTRLTPRGAWSVALSVVVYWRHQMETFSALLPFVRGIHRWPANFPHKGHWPGALMFSFICVWINGWVSNREAGDWRRHCAHYDVIVMDWCQSQLEYIPISHSYMRDSEKSPHSRRSYYIFERSLTISNGTFLLRLYPWSPGSIIPLAVILLSVASKPSCIDRVTSVLIASYYTKPESLMIGAVRANLFDGFS